MSDQYSSYLIDTARQERNTSGALYDLSVTQYNSVLAEYKGLSRTSATSSIDQLISDTYSMLKNVSNALQSAQNTINYITTNQTNYHAGIASIASSNVDTWSNQINSDLGSVLSAQTSVTTNENSLATLLTGADALDVQSSQLSVQQAEQTYSEYFIRAPFDGIVGRIPVNVYDQASGSTVMATVVGDKKIASISLNEVDVAKVTAGQPVNITFDAIDNFTATGTVQSIDQIGTVTSGVVSYGVKIAINTSDPRIKPGMSVNVTIITEQKDNVLLVPSAAVKTQGGKSYVQVLNATPTTGSSTARTGRLGYAGMRQYGTASSTDMMTGTSTGMMASSTFAMGSSTRSFTRTGGPSSQSLTISSAVAPTNVTVTVGDSDDTNTEITGGLNPGQLVVTRTIAAGTATSATAPSILSSLGAGGRTGTGGGGRPATGGTATARPAGN